MTQRAAVYLRISRADEAPILENQRRAALEYAAKLGYASEAVQVYEDTASGGTEDRPGFNDMMRDLRAGDLAIFTSLSRMTRGGVRAAFGILDRLRARGVGWHFVEQPILNFDAQTNPLVRDVILAVLTAVDEDYRRNISVKTRATMARKKAAGWRGKGRKPGAKDRGPRKRRGVVVPANRPLPQPVARETALSSGGV